MNSMADLLGGGSTMLIRKNLRTGQGRGMFGRVDEAVFSDYFGRFAQTNPLATAVSHMSAGSFLIDWQVMRKADLVRSAYYNEFLTRLGIHSVLGLMIWRQGPEVAIINLTRSLRHGDYQPRDAARLTALMPHLLRAVSVSGQMRPGSAEGGLDGAGIERWRDATLLLDGEGKVLHANALARHILDRRDGLALIGGHLTTRDPGIALRLRAVAAASLNRPETARGDTLVVARPGGRRPYLITVVPAKRNETMLFPAEIRVIVTITDLDRRHRPDRGILQTAFGLSPAQANVAALLAAGHSGTEIAESLGISQFTVRRHLADTLERTGTGRQADLVRLLLRIPDEFDQDHGLLH
jgi:DNA-binding CsgD family transcriptional regulator